MVGTVFPHECSVCLTPPTCSAPREYVLLLMQARDFLECLVAEEQRKALEQAPGSYVYRGPFLSRLQFSKELMQHGLHSSVQLGRYTHWLEGHPLVLCV